MANLESRLRELLAGLERDAQEAETAYADDPRLRQPAEAMAAGIRWVATAIREEVLGEFGAAEKAVVE